MPHANWAPKPSTNVYRFLQFCSHFETMMCHFLHIEEYLCFFVGLECVNDDGNDRNHLLEYANDKDNSFHSKKLP